MNLYLYTFKRYFRNNCLDVHMYTETGNVWLRLTATNGWHLIPLAYCFCIYIYIPAFNWCWACWILLSPDGSHFKQQDQDGRPASSMKEWQLNRSHTHTRPYDSRRCWPAAAAAAEKLDSRTAAVIQWLCRVFICFLLLFLFPGWWSSIEGTGNKSSAKKINQWLQHRLRLSVPPLFGCRLSYVRVYILAAQQSKRYAVCVCIHFFFCPSRAVGCGTCCSRPLVILLFVFEGIPSISIVYFVVSFLCEMLSGPPLLLVVWLRLNHRGQSKNEVQHNTFGNLS